MQTSEISERERRNAITARHYQRNKEAIIRKKTLNKVRTEGRVPREKTLEKNGIDRADVVAAMNEFLLGTETTVV
jgi:hypothetical protein